jgi:glycerol-3-phosphate O-acyltransferase / dihydroxyacetone phosphate acyltransferase
MRMIAYLLRISMSRSDKREYMFVSFVCPITSTTANDLHYSLSDLFASSGESNDLESLKQLLVTYSNLLVTAKLTNHVLSDVPLPATLDPSRPTALPTRFSTLWLLIRDTIACLIRLPFFFLPMIVHLPLYGMARLGADIVKEELETQAQMKIAFGVIFSFLIYPTLFFLSWLLLKFTLIGAGLAAIGVYSFAMYHTTLVDANYDR